MINNVLRHVARAIFLCLLLLSSIMAAASAQVSAAPKSGTASLTDVADELRDRFGEVRFHRDEGLEDRFVLRGLKPSAFEVLPRFFRLQQPRFDYSRGFVMENTTNSLPTMYVATSSDGVKVYRLYGFSTPEEEFNRLVNDGPSQKLSGSVDAEARGLLCAEVVYGLASQWWVADPSNAELQAAEHFFSTGHKDGLVAGGPS